MNIEVIKHWPTQVHTFLGSEPITSGSSSRFLQGWPTHYSLCLALRVAVEWAFAAQTDFDGLKIAGKSLCWLRLMLNARYEGVCDAAGFGCNAVLL